MLEFLECVRFTQTDGIVEAEMRLDLRPGSPMDAFLKLIGPAMLKEAGSPADAEIARVIFREIPNHLSIHLKMDATDGTLLQMDLDFSLDESQFEKPVGKGKLVIDMAIKGIRLPPPMDADDLFLPPQGFEHAADITEYFKLKMIQLQGTKEELESGKDFSF